MELKEKINRLERLLNNIEFAEKKENNFDDIYSRLQTEYDIERNGNASIEYGSYVSNLLQTIQKQANVYIHEKKKRPIKGAPDEYRLFISNFKQDVNNELMTLKKILSRTTSTQ